MARRHKRKGSKKTSGKRKRKRAAKPAATRDEEVLADGRAVYAQMKTRFAAIKKADAKRKVKLFPAVALAAFASLIRQASTAMGGHTLKRDTTRGASIQVAQARAVLVDMVQLIRDEVALAYPDDKELLSTVGVGKRLSRETNQDAIAIATEQQQAWEDSTFGPKLRAAGIDKKRYAALIAARRAVSDAGTRRLTIRGAQVGSGIDKRVALSQLKKMTTRARKVAAVVFRNQPRILAAFASGVAKRPPRKRTPKPTPATTPTTVITPIAPDPVHA